METYQPKKKKKEKGKKKMSIISYISKKGGGQGRWGGSRLMLRILITFTPSSLNLVKPHFSTLWLYLPTGKVTARVLNI